MKFNNAIPDMIRSGHLTVVQLASLVAGDIVKNLPVLTLAPISHPRFLVMATALALVTFGAPVCWGATGAPPAQSGASQPSACLLVKNAKARDICLAARKEYSNGKYRLALSMMRGALSASPKEGVIRAQVASILVRMGALPQAERELRVAHADGAPDHAVLPMLFVVMVARHEEAGLLNEFPEPPAKASGDDAADILQGRAMALRSMDRLPEAAAAMDRALSLSRSTDRLVIRSGIAVRQKDAALARKLIDEAYAIAPQDVSVMTAKLDQLERANDTAGVIALADRMQKLYPINSDPRESKIRVFLKQNQDAKAKAEVDAFLALRPMSPLGSFYKAVLMARAHDAKGAGQIIQELPPEFLKAHPQYATQMAEIMLSNGNVETGAAILGTALGSAPDMLEVRLRLARLRMSQDSPQSAMVLLSPVKDDPDPEVQKLLAQVRARIAKNRAF